jgi:hypothetical protein
VSDVQHSSRHQVQLFWVKTETSLNHQHTAHYDFLATEEGGDKTARQDICRAADINLGSQEIQQKASTAFKAAFGLPTYGELPRQPPLVDLPVHHASLSMAADINVQFVGIDRDQPARRWKTPCVIPLRQHFIDKLNDNQQNNKQYSDQATPHAYPPGCAPNSSPIPYPASADTIPMTIISTPLRRGRPTVMLALNAPTPNNTAAEERSPAQIAIS